MLGQYTDRVTKAAGIGALNLRDVMTDAVFDVALLSHRSMNSVRVVSVKLRRGLLVRVAEPTCRPAIHEAAPKVARVLLNQCRA